MELTERERAILEAATKGNIYFVANSYFVDGGRARIDISYDYRTLPAMKDRGLLSSLSGGVFRITAVGKAALEAGK